MTSIRRASSRICSLFPACFYHDGRFATLQDVVEHYDNFFRLALTDKQKNDLIEYLKSL